jgi:hypothetical protein
MKPIKLYFAAVWGGCSNERMFNLINAGVKNVLVSYIYPDQFKGWINNIPLDMEGNIIVDSGAFTAWNKGKLINLDNYIKYAHQIINEVSKFSNQKVYIVNLDVIPGIVGQTQSLTRNRKFENIELIERAANAGFQNMKEMIKQGIKPIHVFHQGESWKWLDKMLEYIDYIGISPANDVSTNERNQWMLSVFEYLYRNNVNVDTHGFAVTNKKILLNLPWTSCDSASWKISAGMGAIYYPQGGFKNSNFSKSALVCTVSDRKIKKGTGYLTSNFLKLLEQDGYSYDDLQQFQMRALINVRYFLELEKWLNVKKSNIVFKIRNNLGL